MTPLTLEQAREAYAAQGAKQFKWSLDRRTGQYRGLNETATVLFSDPQRTVWIAVVPWAMAEGEIVHLAGQCADFKVTWAGASVRREAA